MNRHYDLAIVGGGMVGASLALALAQTVTRPLRIVVFEAFPVPPAPALSLAPSYDARATALAWGSAQIFQSLGVWPALASRAAPIERIEVSDRGHFGITRLSAAEQRVPALGYVVENRCLGRALLERLEACPGVELVAPAEVVSAHAEARGMRVGVEHDGELEEYTAELLVMADGGRSGLREQLGIDYRSRDYEQCAVIANLTLSRAHRYVAYERFTDSGPMALLPLTDDGDGKPRAALVWSVPLDEADEILAWDDSTFLAALQQRFGYRAGSFLRVGERHNYPLQLVRAREQYRRGLAVLGNAAHTLHPIAGQGFNLALRGAMVLAEELAGAAAAGEPLGAPEVLARYAQRMEWDQEKTIGFSDTVTRLFTSNQAPLVMARNLGLLALDLVGPVRRGFARSAMGLDTPAPRLHPVPQSQRQSGEEN